MLPTLRPSSNANDIIATLGLSPHPEGGWYRESWRAAAAPGSRSPVTAIHYLLEAGQVSQWHRVDADEFWCWHCGSALALGVARDDASAVRWRLLGPDLAAGDAPQIVVPKDHWQSARAETGWALVSCIVAPGFDFAGFTLASPGWMPGH